ncbi:MAG: hypothetical protein ACKVQS_14465 [Fimbriimonadaceae bacterium]
MFISTAIASLAFSNGINASLATSGLSLYADIAIKLKSGLPDEAAPNNSYRVLKTVNYLVFDSNDIQPLADGSRILPRISWHGLLEEFAYQTPKRRPGPPPFRLVTDSDLIFMPGTRTNSSTEVKERTLEAGRRERIFASINVLRKTEWYTVDNDLYKRTFSAKILSFSSSVTASGYWFNPYLDASVMIPQYRTPEPQWKRASLEELTGIFKLTGL